MSDKTTTVKVEPSTTDNVAIVQVGSTKVVCDKAKIDLSDSIKLIHENKTIAHIVVSGVPKEVPNLVRRAIDYNECGKWEKDK